MHQATTMMNDSSMSALDLSKAFNVNPLWDQTYEKAQWESQFAVRSNDIKWLQQELKGTQNKLNAMYNSARHARNVARHSQTLKLALDSTTQKLQSSQHELFLLKQNAIDEKALLNEAQQQAARFKRENAALKSHLEEKVAAENLWDEGLRDCEKYVAVLTSRLDEAVAGKNENKKWAFQLASQLDSTHHRLESALRETHELQTSLTEAIEDKRVMDLQVINLEEKLANLNSKYTSDVDEQAHSIDDLKTKLLTSEMNLASTRTALSGEQQARSTLDAHLKDALHDLRGTRADWASARSSERLLQEKLVDAEESSKEYANRMAHLVSQLESTNEKNRSAEVEIELLTKRLAESKEAHNRMVRLKDKTELVNDRLQQELDATRSALSKLQGKIEVQNFARHSLVSQLTGQNDSCSSRKENEGKSMAEAEFSSALLSRLGGLENATVDYALHKLKTEQSQ